MHCFVDPPAIFLYTDVIDFRESIASKRRYYQPITRAIRVNWLHIFWKKWRSGTHKKNDLTTVNPKG
jgi:hypothetical protein